MDIFDIFRIIAQRIFCMISYAALWEHRVDFEYRKCFRKYPAKAAEVKLTAHSMVKASSNAFPSNTATAAYGTIPNAEDRTERITEILKSPFL